MNRIALFITFLFFLTLPVASAQAQTTGSIDLLWQGETYVPPLYQGRSLWSYESRVTVTAIASVPGFSSEGLYYRWTKDGTVLGSLSGVSRVSLTFAASVLASPIEIKVDVRNGEDGPILASSTVVLEPIASRVLVVEDNPLYGLMLHRPVASTFALMDDEVTFAALPLFARVSYRSAPALAYTWTTNTGDVRTGSSVTYRAPEGSSGSSSVSLKVVNSSVIELPQQKSFLIQFGNNTGF